MTEEQIRKQLRAVQAKWHTPISKIAKDIGLDKSLVSRFVNDKMQENERPSKNLLNLLQNWILARI